MTADVQQIMREIRGVVRAETREREELLRVARRNIPSTLPAALARLQSSAASLEELANRLGEVPPSPPTLRGRAGALVIRAMQRALFWLLPSLRIAHQTLAMSLREHVSATEELMKSLHRTNVELELLRRQVGEPGITACNRTVG